jgi:cytochrome P450
MSTAPVLHARPGTPYPDGPSLVSRIRSGDLFRLNPLPFLTSSAERFGDLVHYRAAGRHIFQANHPELVGEMLLRDARYHHRGLVMQKAKYVLGHGLLTSEDPHHMRQRRLSQPAFHRDRIAAYGETIGAYARDAVEQWQDGEIRELHASMQLLTLRIVGKTLFNSEMESVNLRIAASVEAFMGFLPLAFLPGSDLIIRMPFPRTNRIRKSKRELDQLIYGIIAERRRNPADHGDLLSMLLAAQDTEENTGGMTDEQVRDECVTALLAGNETAANGLTFALWLLARYPETQETLHSEAVAALAERTATAADYSALPYAHACFAEAMRLYPPVWTIARTAAEEYVWRGFKVPKNSILLAPQWVVHRDPRFWKDPQRFQPERFLENAPKSEPSPTEAQEPRPRFAYFPFAAGNRQCIGEGLAWMEGVLILATIARGWKVSLTAEDEAKPELAPDPKVTLRPRAGVRLLLTRR